MSVKDMVLEGLERCRLHDGSVCKNCNYSHTECVEGLCADALKLIEQQQAEIDRLKAEQPKWIPVSEKLPKKPDVYPKCELRRMYFLVSLESGCVESLGFDFDDNRWHTTGSPVVAWMKLPEPPKDGEQE